MASLPKNTDRALEQSINEEPVMQFFTDYDNVVRYRNKAVAKTTDRVANLMAAVGIAGIILALLWMIALTAAGNL